MVSRALVLALALAGCDYVTSSFKTNDFSGDPFPIFIDQSSGAILVGLREPGNEGQRTAVLDVMSPITLIDRGPGVAPRIGITDLTVLGARAPGGDLDHPRAVLREHRTYTLHPCQTTECEVGTGIGPRPFNALVGLDAFGGDALRLRLASDEIFILPDIAGDDLRRARSCDAVFDSPFRGGGTLLVGGTEVSFANWRIAIDACIAPVPARSLAQSARGVDALFVLSSAIGTSLLSASAYERYRLLDPINIPMLETLPEHTVLLPSGPVTGYLTDVPSIALVGNSSGNRRAPCRQMWASHLLAARNCLPAGPPGVGAYEVGGQCTNPYDDDGDGVVNDGCAADDCPCTGTGTFCAVPAVVELAPAGRIPILVVADAEPTLQALRTELRPDRPEVDGILGTEAIEALELDIDYAHDRLLGRCTDRTTCGARAALADAAARAYVNGCLDEMPGPIVLDDN